jgi:hypothetical protein
VLLKFNKNTELEILGIGTFIPGQFVVTDDEAKAKKYIDSGYFDIVKEKKKRKKSKKKGVDK